MTSPSSERTPPQSTVDSDEVRTRRWLTIPNVLCSIRLAGSFLLAALALAEHPDAFLWLFVFLWLTDWIDGKLAILLHQRSVIGARLDSWADATLYTALLFGGLWLRWGLVRGELPWLVPAVSSYAAATAVGLWKFRRWPSYHTRAAKTCWFLIAVGAVCVLGGWTLWPLRIALAAVTLTNLESIAITWLSSEWRANVHSVFALLRSPKKDGS